MRKQKCEKIFLVKNKCVNSNYGAGAKTQYFNTQKTGHSSQKQDIEAEISQLEINKPTKDNILLLFSIFGFDGVFSRSDIIRHTGLTPSPASTLINKLKSFNLIEEVTGQGKGKYKFKKK